MKVGDKIQWKAVNRVVSGVVTSVKGRRHLARLANGKYVIVDQTSIIDYGKEED